MGPLVVMVIDPSSSMYIPVNMKKKLPIESIYRGNLNGLNIDFILGSVLQPTCGRPL